MTLGRNLNGQIVTLLSLIDILGPHGFQLAKEAMHSTINGSWMFLLFALSCLTLNPK